VYPSRFRYESPRSLDDAIGLLHDGGGEAKVLAGGQSLIPLLKLRFASPELLVDINEIPGLAYVQFGSDGALHIGALCRHAHLEHSSLLSSSQPTMAAAAPLIADPIVASTGARWSGRCATRTTGRLGVGRRRWVAHVIAAALGQRAIPCRSSSAVRSEHAGVRRDRIEAVIPRRRERGAGSYLKLERRR
jgi:carbon-monoxide dehydrogenase medium subunit